jgi:hypothetical protein
LPFEQADRDPLIHEVVLSQQYPQPPNLVRVRYDLVFTPSQLIYRFRPARRGNHRIP